VKIVSRLMTMLLPAALAGRAPAPTQAPHHTEPIHSGSPSTDAGREAVLFALTLIGTPYRNGGTTPQSGFDCSGFVWYVYRQAASLALPRSANELGRAGQPVSADELRPGDLVFYNTLGSEFSHVGIYIGGDRFVHAPSSGGNVSIVSMRNAYWAQRYSGARRIVS
jgi:cell wall-associated NlpC family hydrolase